MQGYIGGLKYLMFPINYKQQFHTDNLTQNINQREIDMM